MSSSPSPVVLIEFNELTPRLVRQFMRTGRLPNFQRFFNESQVYVTDADEEGENLNPWVQWVTVHTGLRASEHGVRWLSDGHKLQAKAVWDHLSEAGHKVWVCGSMNVRYDKPLNGYLLPDPWTTGATPYPKDEFDAYLNFVQGSVQEHTDRAAAGSKKWAAVRFLAYMATHGLSAGTVGATLRQVLCEKIRRRGHWKRAALLDRFQWDVFRTYYRRLRPDFSTFFLNSTAHFQHSYWRNMEPEAFSVKPPADDREGLRDAILYGYQQMDRLLGQMMSFFGPKATLVYCTGLSQQPYLKYEATGGKRFYRLRDRELLVTRLGITGDFTYQPVMAEQFCLQFKSETEATAAKQRLDRFVQDGNPVFECLKHGEHLMTKCRLHGAVPDEAPIVGGDGSAARFFDLFYQVESLKSGYHHPDGMLWIRRPDHAHQVYDDRVPLHAITPAILEAYGLSWSGPSTGAPLAGAFGRQLVPVGAGLS